VDVDQLEDLIGNQQLNSHRFGTHVTNQILKLLKRSDDRLTLQIFDLIDGLTPSEIASLLRNNFKARRLQNLKESINEISKEVVKTTSTVLGDEGKKYAEYEVRRGAAVAYAAGIEDLGAKVSVSGAYAAAVSRPMNGRHIRDHIKQLGESHRREILAAITQGFVLSESPSVIMSRIRGTAIAKRKDGLLYKRNGKIERLIVRSALTHISSVATLHSYGQIGVHRYYLSPVFDGRTSDICRALNAQGIDYYEIGDGPVPPLHPGGCRTIILPEVPNAENIRKPFVNDTRPVGKIPKSERDSKIGTTTARSFEAHLRRQSVSLQRDWLGPSRYKLWKEGGIALDRFADPIKGRAYNLAEIESRNADVFASVGL